MQFVSLSKMLAAAEVMVEDFAFLRGGFYELNQQLLFGEMTFYPASGFSQLNAIGYNKQSDAFWQWLFRTIDITTASCNISIKDETHMNMNSSLIS